MSNNRPPGPIVIVGALPPPLGGVTIHCQRVMDRLRSLGYDVVVVNPQVRANDSDALTGLQALRALLKARRNRTPVFLNYSCSTELVRAAKLWVASRAIAPSRLALVQHNGAFPTTIQAPSVGGRLQRSLVRRARVFMCLSDSIQAAVEKVAPGLETVRGCSFLPDEILLASRRIAERSPDPLIVTSGYRIATYQFVEVIAAFRQLAEDNPAARLQIYAYGSTDPQYWQTVVDAAGQDPRVQIIEDASHENFLAALAKAHVYVRNTTHDAYGVAVAEALFLGSSAVATSVCERAPGTALYELGDSDALLSLLNEALAQPPNGAVQSDDGTDAYLEAIAVLAEPAAMTSGVADAA